MYTIQVSNHPQAGLRVPTEAGAASWKTVYDGPAESGSHVRDVVDHLADYYQHARAFRGKAVGKLWYAVLR